MQITDITLVYISDAHAFYSCSENFALAVSCQYLASFEMETGFSQNKNSSLLFLLIFATEEQFEIHEAFFFIILAC